MRVQIRYNCKGTKFLQTDGAETHFSIRESDLTDVEVLLVGLDSTLFPGVSSSVQVHDGFRNEHAKTASAILGAVKSLMSSKNTKNVVAVSTILLLCSRPVKKTERNRLGTLSEV